MWPENQSTNSRLTMDKLREINLAALSFGLGMNEVIMNFGA